MSADALRSLSSNPRPLQIYTPVYAGQYKRTIYNREQLQEGTEETRTARGGAAGFHESREEDLHHRNYFITSAHVPFPCNKRSEKYVLPGSKWVARVLGTHKISEWEKHKRSIARR